MENFKILSLKNHTIPFKPYWYFVICENKKLWFFSESQRKCENYIQKAKTKTA